MVEIVEQPASNALRFRYECEGRCTGIVLGSRSSQERKSYPSIRIIGYTGLAEVIISCVTVAEPYRAHPHKIVTSEQRGTGFYSKEICCDGSDIVFEGIAIWCTKRTDTKEALRIREQRNIDPFRSNLSIAFAAIKCCFSFRNYLLPFFVADGFGHADDPKSININAVRLCFHVSIVDPCNGTRVWLAPVVSEPIIDKKSCRDLEIVELSDYESPAFGAKKIIMLCEKVNMNDIEVEFYMKNGRGEIIWDQHAKIEEVHYHTSIVFKTPKYPLYLVGQVFVRLLRPSDRACSKSIKFTYLQSTNMDYRHPLPIAQHKQLSHKKMSDGATDSLLRTTKESNALITDEDYSNELALLCEMISNDCQDESHSTN